MLLVATQFGFTQNKKEQSVKDILSKSYVLIDIETFVSDIKLDSLFNSNYPLAIDISKATHFKYLKKIRNLNKKVVIITEQNIDSLIENNSSIVQVFPKEIKRLDSAFISNKVDQSANTKDFTRTRLSSAKDLITLWMQHGKRPNFIETDSNSLVKADSIISYLNSLKTVSGTIKTEKGELVSNVKFKDYKESIVDGEFNFPIIEGERLPILIPHKAGYHFSPDIVYTTLENLDNHKNFKALQLDLDFGLSDYFVFDSEFRNMLVGNRKGLLVNNVEYKKDTIRGKVGYFNNRSYIDTGIESKNSLQNSFTISAWINPVNLGANNSILGKGDNFVVKLHNGFLTFTIADIKDYISKTSPIPLNKWTHIVLVHSKIDNSLFFYINGKLTEEVKLISEYVTSDYNILIGTNLWEEFFEGYLDEIKIWERELNSNEITILFNQKEEGTFNKTFKTLIIVLGVLFTIILVLLWKRKSTKKTSLLYKQQQFAKRQEIVPKANEGMVESVLCFGKLRILDKEGINVAEKLSPLLKKIFIIVFLYSNQGGKKGISTKQLTEFLWTGMNPQKAKNNRGTNINNLRAILNSCSEIDLVFKNKYWFIELSENCFCDYQVIQKYLDSFSKEEYSKKELEVELPKFLNILKEGRLFSNSSEPWLDSFIEKFSNKIIEQCLNFTEILSIDKQGDLLYQLAEVICIYDDLNVKANKLKFQILIQQGKLSLAYKTYDSFIKLYAKIYNEPYSMSFEEMTSKQIT